MIGTLSLQYFRQHESLTVQFERGLNAIRGPNEGGKTTLIEAMGYAWFGANFLRDSLSDVVTWGHKESELKVTLTHHVQGVTYTFTRSKSGAECNYSVGGQDKKVVGQKEVSAFAGELLGSDAKTASLLMMASQDGLRGALDEGPAAVSGLMGKLADFDLIDRIMENAQADLTLGSDTALLKKLTDAQAEAAQLGGEIPSATDLLILRANIETAEATHAEWKVKLAEAEPARAQAEAAYNDGVNRKSDLARLQADVAQARSRIAQTEGKIEAAVVTARCRPAPGEIDRLRELVRQEADHQRVANAYALFTKLPAYPTVFWDQDQASFNEELVRQRAAVADLGQQRSRLAGQVTAWTSQRITSGKCPTCGSTTVDDAHIAEHNGKLDASIAEANARITEIQGEVANLNADIAALVALQADATSRADKVSKIPVEFIVLDISVYPPRVSWAGAVPEAAPTGQAAKDLVKVEADQRAADVADGQAAAHRSTLKEQTDELEALTQRLANTPDVDLAPLEEAYNTASAAYTLVLTEVNTAAQAVADLTTQASNLQAAIELAQSKLDNANARVAEYTKDLETLAFNNNLVAKLRKLKPAITDHLWNTVLAAVSSFFSQMRGETSVVTKDAKGFSINGYPVSSFSGSTLDILALAIRVALTKTFIPYATFMTLDEPAHGCNKTRTGNVLGFLTGVGLDQVILATHDDLSESVADHLIQLGQ